MMLGEQIATEIADFIKLVRGKAKSVTKHRRIDDRFYFLKIVKKEYPKEHRAFSIDTVFKILNRKL